MSATGDRSRGARGPRSRHHRVEEPENHERWLLTYADMITLLMALFMVLFSISSVNTSKFKYLEKSLKAAFAGHVLPGGSSILKDGAAPTPTRSLTLTHMGANPMSKSVAAHLSQLQSELGAANVEQRDLAALAHKINRYASAHGFAKQVNAQVQRRGLVVTVLTDKLLFASGAATLRPAGLPLLDEITRLLMLDTEEHPIVVEGYTDNEPIDTAQFPSNWELSTDRATTVVRYLISRGLPERRLSAAGYADQFPVASNATAAGRAENRRVEIVLQRINPDPVNTTTPKQP